MSLSNRPLEKANHTFVISPFGMIVIEFLLFGHPNHLENARPCREGAVWVRTGCRSDLEGVKIRWNDAQSYGAAYADDRKCRMWWGILLSVLYFGAQVIDSAESIVPMPSFYGFILFLFSGYVTIVQWFQF